jgi:hypothetical protein
MNISSDSIRARRVRAQQFWTHLGDNEKELLADSERA